MILTLCDVVISNDRRHVVSFVKMPRHATTVMCVGCNRLVRERERSPRAEGWLWQSTARRFIA